MAGGGLAPPTLPPPAPSDTSSDPTPPPSSDPPPRSPVLNRAGAAARGEAACPVPELGRRVEQRFYAAASGSLMSPPRTGRCRTRPSIGSGTGDSGRSGAGPALDAAAACCSAQHTRQAPSIGAASRKSASVRQLGPHSQHEAFGEAAVRSRTAGRDLDDLDAHIRRDRVERGCELSRAIANQEPELRGTLAEVHHQVAGLLSRPGPVRLGGHAQAGSAR
jgi:hypothetical protein